MANTKQKKIMRNDSLVFDTLAEWLFRYGKVKVQNFGIFSLRKIKARQGYIPSTGSRTLLEAKVKIKFSPSKNLRDKIQTWKRKK